MTETNALFADKETRLEDIRKRIDDAVAALPGEEKWLEWLAFASRFHTYSFNNQLLIAMQRREATHVAGAKKWGEMGRNIVKGEKAIWIMAPMVKKVKDDTDPTDDGVRRIVGFRAVPVFDVAQTEGAPVAEDPRVDVGTAEGQAPSGMHADLDAAIAAAGFRVVLRDLSAEQSGARGWTDGAAKEVVVDSSLGDAAQAAVKAHELAHIRLGHLDRLDDYHAGHGGQRGRMETEAESVAYILCDRYGLDNAPQSFSYINNWVHGDAKLVRLTAETVVRVAKEIIDGLDASGAQRKTGLAAA